MTSNKNMVKMAGVLILLQLTAAILSYSVILEPILYGSNDFLAALVEKTTMAKIAMLLDFMVGAAWFGATILLYPILKKYSERIALWFCGIRLAEFITLIISGILLLIILYTGQKYVQAEASDASYLKTLGHIIRNARGSTQDLSLMAYSIGSAFFFYLMFITKLIPRFLSILGFIGIAGILTEILMSIFNYPTGSFMYIIMMPMGLTEIILGLWLIVKGLKLTPAITQSKID